MGNSIRISALDKLLGIYATCLSSIAYLQKQLHIFYNFLRHVFWQWLHTLSYSIKPSWMSLHINSHRLPTSGFLLYVKQISSPCWHVASIHFAKVFLLKYLTGGDILFIKLQLYCTLASKKNQYPTGICILHKWKRNGPNGTQWHRM